jgi:hypothetical protein
MAREPENTTAMTLFFSSQINPIISTIYTKHRDKKTPISDSLLCGVTSPLLNAFAMIRKELRQLVKKLLPPLMDLVGVNAILCGDLGNCFLSSDRLQGNPRLEDGIVTPAHVSRHAVPPYDIGRLTCTLLPCPVFGESYRPYSDLPHDLFMNL